MVLPVLAVVIVIAAWTAGLLRPMARAMRIPALLLLSILVVNSLFFPGAHGQARDPRAAVHHA